MSVWTHSQRHIIYSLVVKSYMKQALIFKHVLMSDGKPNVFLHDMNKHKYISYHTSVNKNCLCFYTDALFFFSLIYLSGDASKTRLTMFYKSSKRAERKHVLKANMRLKYHGICIWKV